MDVFVNGKISRRRWEIEESFRIMKSEFRARPVYIHKDSRIRAHFMTCYTRTEITDALHDAFGFRTDKQLITDKKMKEIIRSTKK